MSNPLPVGDIAIEKFLRGEEGGNEAINAAIAENVEATRNVLGLGGSNAPITLINDTPYGDLSFGTYGECFCTNNPADPLVCFGILGANAGDTLAFIESTVWSIVANGGSATFDVQFPAGATWQDFIDTVAASLSESNAFSGYFQYILDSGSWAAELRQLPIPNGYLITNQSASYTYPPYQVAGGNQVGMMSVVNRAIWDGSRWVFPPVRSTLSVNLGGGYYQEIDAKKGIENTSIYVDATLQPNHRIVATAEDGIYITPQSGSAFVVDVIPNDYLQNQMQGHRSHDSMSEAMLYEYPLYGYGESFSVRAITRSSIGLAPGMMFLTLNIEEVQ